MTRFINKYLTVLCGAGLFLPVGAALGGEGEEVPKSISKTISKQVVSEQEVEARADKSMTEANNFFIKNQYKDAIDKYLEAIASLQQLGSSDNKFFKKKIDKCKEQISQAYYYWAMDTALEADKKEHAKEFDEAIKMCKNAMEMYPPCKKKMEDRIAYYEKMKNTVNRRNQTDEAVLMPDKKDQDYNIQVMLKQAKTLYDNKQYDLAKNKYEQVLVIDPYRDEAVNGLRSVNIKMNKTGDKRAMDTFVERIAEVEWKWATPIQPEASTANKDVIEKPVVKETSENKIQQKLKSIVIPRIDFEDVTIQTAIKYLREQSKQLDPEGVGVNIFLRLSATPIDKAKQAAAAQAAPAAPAGGGGAAGGMPPGAAPAQEAPAAEQTATDVAAADVPINTQTINLILSKKTLLESIHFVCQAAKLKFRVEKYAVIIASQDVPLDDLETKIYPVEQSSLSAIGNGDDPAALMAHFEQRSINFPLGAKVVYDSRISRLIATNTPENLRKIEQVIANELSSKDPMVQIQAKFVEISQNDFKEFGFEYLVNRSLPASENNTANGKLQFDTNDPTLRSMYPNSQDRLFVYHNESDGWSFTATYKALNQANTQDILSSPRITTLNGQEASIRMIREVYYATDYTQAQLTTTTNTSTSGATGTMYTYVSPIPQYGDATELGIILRVTPEIDLERRTITMQMNPSVQALVGWTTYEYTTAIGTGTPKFEYTKMPVLAQRTIDTKVTIYDGETIVLGGIIKDKIATINDSIPVLGDIPLVGRFFQSQGSSSEKTNLLIFLTCRLVKPDGSAFFPDTAMRGVPEFKRLR
jgi:general secretion pathway protein D